MASKGVGRASGSVSTNYGCNPLCRPRVSPLLAWSNGPNRFKEFHRRGVPKLHLAQLI